MLSVCSQEVIGLPALPLDSDIIFLSDFDGTDYATTAIDRSAKAAHMSFFGNAHLDVLIKKFGSASYSAGSGASGIRLPVDADYASLIIGDFTIEGEVYAPTSFGTTIVAGVFAAGSNTDQRLWAFHLNSGNLSFAVYAPGGQSTFYVDVAHGMVGGQFYHIAVCRCGAKIRIFVEGVMISSDIFPVRSFLPNPTSIGLSIGCDWDLTSGYPMTGNLDAMRITKKAWYRTDASFTPPTNTYGTIGPGLFVDTDTFYAPRMTPYFLTPSLVIDIDIFHQPRVSPQTLVPGLLTDTDIFPIPSVHVASIWDTTYSHCALSGANLVATNNVTTSTDAGAVAQVGNTRNSGLIYYEITATNVGGAAFGIGMVVTSFNYGPLSSSGSAGLIFLSSGHVWAGGVDLGAVMPAMVSGDVYGVALHLGRRLVWFKKVNGTPGNWNNNSLADPTTAIGGFAIPAGSFVLPAITFGGSGGTNSNSMTANFGQAAFVGTVPVGYERGYVGGY